jgi:hypothetical protein
MAGPTGLEPATSNVTGWRSNQLNYDPAMEFQISNSRFQIGFNLKFAVSTKTLLEFAIWNLKFSKTVGIKGLEPLTSSL